MKGEGGVSASGNERRDNSRKEVEKKENWVKIKKRRTRKCGRTLVSIKAQKAKWK